MRAIGKGLGFIALLGLVAAFPAPALAEGAAPAGWPGWHLQAAFLGLLTPLALILLAVGATPPEEAVETVARALVALVAGLVAYVACGFAFQYGGVFLQLNWPGLAGLAAEWSPLDPSLGVGWGVVGVRGFLMGGGAATPDAYALAVAQLPAVAVAVLVPTMALARQVGRGLLVAVAAIVGGLLYPMASNWVWSGGWLAQLGLNAGWGHGFVDLGGSATLHTLGASIAAAGVLFLHREAGVQRRTAFVDLPPVHFPLFMLAGALLAPAGWLGLVLANPLLPADVAPGLVALSLVLAGLGGAAPGLFYSWLATGRVDPLLAARGLVAGLVASSASCGLVPPFAALGAGLLAGAVLPVLLYGLEHGLRWRDPGAALATHGAPGLLGALWLALFADGRFGVGWNGVHSPFGVAQQGVAGLVVAPGFASDVPGQLWAQLTGVGSIAALGFCASLLLFGLARGGQALSARFASAPRRRPPRVARR